MSKGRADSLLAPIPLLDASDFPCLLFLDKKCSYKDFEVSEVPSCHIQEVTNMTVCELYQCQILPYSPRGLLGSPEKGELGLREEKSLMALF